MKNTRVRIMCIVGVLAATSFVLTLLRVPYPLFEHFKYDLSDVPALIGAFTLGPAAGIAVILLRNVIYAMVRFDPVGILMNTLASGTLALLAGFVYRRMHSQRGAAIGMVAGVLASTALMVPANLLITPLYTGLPRATIWAMILPAIIPFNLTRGLLVGICTFVLYKRVSALIPHNRPGRDTLEVVEG